MYATLFLSPKADGFGILQEFLKNSHQCRRFIFRVRVLGFFVCFNVLDSSPIWTCQLSNTVFPPIVVATTILFEFVDWREFQIDAAMLANSPTYIRLFFCDNCSNTVCSSRGLWISRLRSKAQKSDPEGFKLLFGTITGHSYGTMFA